MKNIIILIFGAVVGIAAVTAYNVTTPDKQSESISAYNSTVIKLGDKKTCR